MQCNAGVKEEKRGRNGKRGQEQQHRTGQEREEIRHRETASLPPCPCPCQVQSQASPGASPFWAITPSNLARGPSFPCEGDERDWIQVSFWEA